MGTQGELLATFKQKLKLSTASKPLSFVTGVDRAVRIFDKFGRTGENTKRLVAFVLMRQSKLKLTDVKLEELKQKNILTTSIVMEDAVHMKPAQLSNFGMVVNAKS